MKNKRPFLPAFVIELLLSALVLVFVQGCGGGDESNNGPDPIFRDAFSFYVLDPGPFEVAGPEEPNPSEREFLILRAGEVELNCGRFVGAHIASGAEQADLASFASEVMNSPNWLPGCFKWMLDAGEVVIGGRLYYTITSLVRRDPAMTERMSRFQLLVHEREFDTYPVNEDRIVRIYYALHDRDIYILTLSGPPEDVVTREADTRRVLAGVRFSATEALAALGETLDPGDE